MIECNYYFIELVTIMDENKSLEERNKEIEAQVNLKRKNVMPY